jgi:DNA-binding PadR family transcriptional regulator
MLSKQEELILLAVWRLEDEAYGVKILKYLKDVTGIKMSIGGIYVPLDRLVRKGCLRAWQGAPTPERGGMSKRYFKLTDTGVEALKETKRIHDTLWDGLSQVSPDIGQNR